MANADFSLIQNCMSNIKVMAGSFAPNGVLDPTVKSGKGFTVTRTNPGQYKVQLDDDYPACICGEAMVGLNTVGGVKAQLGVINTNRTGSSAKSAFINLVGASGSNVAEVSTIACPADTGAFAVSSITVSSGATHGNGDFITYSMPNGDTYAFYLVIGGTLPTLSGAVITAIPAAKRIPVYISSASTATQVAQNLKAAINATLGTGTVATSSVAIVTATRGLMGPVSATAGYDATSTVSALFTCSETTTGVLSNLNSKYFVLNTALDVISYYVWFNVNGEGIDPAVTGKIGVQVALTTASANSAVATAMAAVLAALTTSFASATAMSNTVTVTNAAVGQTTDLSAGTTSGFTLTVTTQGNLVTQDLPLNTNNIVNFTLYLNNSTLDY